MASAYDEGMGHEVEAMRIVRPHLYGGKSITPRMKAKGIALLQQAFAAYDRDERLGGIDAGLLDVESYKRRRVDRARVESELRSLGARTFAGPPPLNTYEEAFAIVKGAEGKAGKGRAKVLGAARVRILDVDHAPERIVVEVVAGGGVPVGTKLTFQRSELYAPRFADENAAFGALVKKYWGDVSGPGGGMSAPASASYDTAAAPRAPRRPGVRRGAPKKAAAPKKAKRGGCGDCGGKLDAREGMTVRGPLDSTLVCLPCGDKRHRGNNWLGAGHPEDELSSPAVLPPGYGDVESTGKRKGQLRMFNPREERDNPAAGLVWLPYIEGGKPSLSLKAKTHERSGAYAIRRKDSHGVVYVGESRQGHLWRTIARHFQAPETFTNPKKPGGANAFATDDGQAYEVAAVVTSKGYRTHAKSDQRALNLQARWIRDFLKAGHRLKNRDDGMSDAMWKKQQAKEKKEAAAGSFEFGANAPREWYENPGAALTFLGLLTRLELASGLVLAWSLKDAPWLAYDSRGRLVIAYPGRVARASTPAEVKEYKRSHWGVTPPGKVKDCGFAVGPWKELGPASSITYTTRKGLDEKLVDYVHPFGKRGVGRPRLVEHRCKGGCAARCAAAGSVALLGGSYTMTEHGIVG